MKMYLIYGLILILTGVALMLTTGCFQIEEHPVKKVEYSQIDLISTKPELDKNIFVPKLKKELY